MLHDGADPVLTLLRRVRSVVARILVWIIVACSGCRQAQVPAPIVEQERESAVKIDEPSATPVPSSPNGLNFIQPQFSVVTPEIGIQFTFDSDIVPDRFLLPEIFGGGLAWIDYDRDGWFDLFIPNGCALGSPQRHSNSTTGHLWRNFRGNAFTEVTTQADAGLVMFGQGCAVADYDNDGFDDLFIAGYGPDRLLKNRGDGTFEDVTDKSGVSRPDWTTGAIWIDVDGDHDLDLYCVTYLNVTQDNHKVCSSGGQAVYCGPGSFEATQDQCFLNLGDGTFQEATDRLGFRAEKGNGLSVAAVDLNDDLVPEIYVANDMTPNFLFERQAITSSTADQPLYREIATPSGCSVSGSGESEASMGIALADFDGDGRTDIYLTHYFRMKNTLYRNRGNLIFDDISHLSKATSTSYEFLGFGTVSLDYDRDGDQDLFVANGHVLGPAQQPNEMRPQLLENNKGVFRDVSSGAGPYFDELWLGRSVAACDYDNDGDVDLAISHIGRPFVLLRNDTPASCRQFVGLKLTTTDRNVPVGGRVVLHTSHRKITYPLVTGGSYMAAQDPRILAGWPETENLQVIEVFWPSGRIDRWTDLEVCRYWNLIEGSVPLN